MKNVNIAYCDIDDFGFLEASFVVNHGNMGDCQSHFFLCTVSHFRFCDFGVYHFWLDTIGIADFASCRDCGIDPWML